MLIQMTVNLGSFPFHLHLYTVILANELFHHLILKKGDVSCQLYFVDMHNHFLACGAVFSGQVTFLCS